MTIAATTYAQLATASEGAAVRAALGSAASIIPADTLRTFTDAQALPARPFIAYRGGSQSGNRRDGSRAQFRWWIYDDARYGYSRINALIPLMIAAYPDEDALSDLYTVFNGASDERPDAAIFQMPCRSLTFTAFTRS